MIQIIFSPKNANDLYTLKNIPMRQSNPLHNFHIPVMGLAFTIDTPIRVAHFGISSVISIMDDDLIEKMNAHYSAQYNLEYQEISTKVFDYRAKRITAYLNLVDKIVRLKFAQFKTELAQSRFALQKFISMLPPKSTIRAGFERLAGEQPYLKDEVAAYCEKYLDPGQIDVNIMTKVDRENFEKNTPLPIEFNDAHAALRGFANSTLSSSVVLSAGLNPRLFGYFENFGDFFPDENLNLKKKITIKVSDFRSAMIQGSFFAKKGLWVSEFRIESGLNCGGHAFATDRLLMGPILEEFKQKKESLAGRMHELLCKALAQKNRRTPTAPMTVKISVQGGVGTAEEHDFLLNHYNADSIGWGSPFLLVPEATSTDNATRTLLAGAREADLYTSNMSPLGVPFNTVRGSSGEIARDQRIESEKPGSSCPKKYLALNTEYGKKPICTASRKFQEIKLAELELAHYGDDDPEYIGKKNEITQKSCLCVGLANASLLEKEIRFKGDRGVIVCPGPNIAYFDREYSLAEMVGHIYGSASVLNSTKRPNLFIKELNLYWQSLRSQLLARNSTPIDEKQCKTLKENLLLSIDYYKTLFASVSSFRKDFAANTEALASIEMELFRTAL